MTTLAKRPGRPAKGSVPRILTPFGAAIVAALDARRQALRDGPRTLSDLARACGYAQPTLHKAVTGARPFPARLEAAIRAALPELHE